MNNNIYDHYIAIDWSIKNMAIARMTKKSNQIKVINVPSDIRNAQDYLNNLNGKKILVIEETTTAQWLYTELKDCVDKLIICDPHRNKLLSEGAKTDMIDASKLVRLLKAELVKEVYHSSEVFLYLRRLVSGYEDLVKAGVRLKNQRYSLLRACGKSGNEKKGIQLDSKEDQYVLNSIERQIANYEEEKQGYKKEFEKLSKKYPQIRNQKSLPGIKNIHGVKIVARVVSPYRFKEKGAYLSYAGLIKLEKMSGGRSYGKKKSRFCPQLKNVYKTAVAVCIKNKNPINDYYKYLIKEKGYSEHNARNAACRKLAILSLGVFKSNKKYCVKKSESNSKQKNK